MYLPSIHSPLPIAAIAIDRIKLNSSFATWPGVTNLESITAAATMIVFAVRSKRKTDAA